MNVSVYKKRFVVMSVVALAIGFSASFVMAQGGMARLSDAVQAASYDEVTAPAPFADPVPNAASEGAAGAATVDSGVASISSDSYCADSCDYESCRKPYVLGEELNRLVGCCSKPKGLWFRTDYLLWWTKGGTVPALVTTSSHGSDGSGIIGSPYTRVLYGNREINYPNRSGVKVSGGLLLDCCGRSVEFDYFTLGKARDGRTFSSTGDYTAGNEFLARPFIDFATGQNAAQEVAGDRLRGRVTTEQSEFFQSFGVWYRRPVWCPVDPCCGDCCDDCCGDCCDDCCGESCSFNSCGLWQAVRPRAWRVDFIAGWRNYQLDEWTTVEENLVVKNYPPYVVGSTFDIRDEFETENHFNGADLGLSAQLCRGRWSFDMLAKVALGRQTQVARINGQTIIDDTVDPAITYEGGLLALSSNMGHYSRNKFAAIPEFGGEISYQLTKYLRAHVGYHVVYWSNVVRSGALIDTTVDQTQIPPATGTGTRPAFSWNESDYWAQGLNFGLEARF